MKNTQVSANNSPYLRNGARWDHSYSDYSEVAYALSIGTKIDKLG